MLRHRHLLLAVLAALGAIGACTQDFSQFDPDGSNDTSTTSTMTGSGGAGAAGGATTTTTTTTTTGTTGENCIDGSDNDGDGAIDCADTDDCGGYECVDRPNDVWEGPGILYAGPPDTIPACPPDFPVIAYEGFGDPVQEDAICTACSCSMPTVTCTPQDLIAFGNSSCGGGSTQVPQPMQGTCGTLDVPGGTGSYRAPAPQVTATACTPSGGMATVPPPLANIGARVCTASIGNAGCSDQGQMCIPSDIGAPFEPRMCVWRTGNQGCPNNFGDKFLFATELDDTRGCTACQCGSANATCTATTTIYSDGACASQLATVPNTNACVQAGDGQSIMVSTTTTGSCPDSGGQPTGSVDLGTMLTTVCCR